MTSLTGEFFWNKKTSENCRSLNYLVFLIIDLYEEKNVASHKFCYEPALHENDPNE